MSSGDRVPLLPKRRLAILSDDLDRSGGFTFVELVIAMAIGGIISLAVVSSISQVINGSARSSNHMAAMRQVQNAGYWVSRDAAMAHSTNTTTVAPDFMIFSWTDWDTDDRVQVKYVMEDASGGLKNLRRIQVLNDNVIGSSLVGQNIDPLGTSTTPPPSVIFTVTARVGSGARASTETRTYEIKPRPGT